MADMFDLKAKVDFREVNAATEATKKLGDETKKVEKGLKGLESVGGPVGRAAGAINELRDRSAGAADATALLGRGATAAVLGVAAIGTAAVAAVGATVKLALAIADVADNMNDLANRSNIATERLSVYDAIAKMAGSSVEELVSSAERLGSKLARQDEESGRAAKALKELGISTKDANGQQKSMLALQEEIILTTEKATDRSKAEGAAVQLLGNDYYKLRTAVKEAAESKRQMYDYMQKVGAVVTTKLAKDSDTLNDNISKLGLAFTGMGQSIATIVIPILNTVIEKIGAIAEDAAALIRKYTGNSTATEVVDDRINNTQKQLDYQIGLRGSVRYKDPKERARIEANIARLQNEQYANQNDAILARRSNEMTRDAAINGTTTEGNRPAGRDSTAKAGASNRLSAADIYRMQQEDLQRHYADQAQIDELNKQEALARDALFVKARLKQENDFFAAVERMEDEYITKGQEAFKQRQEQWTKDHEALMQVGDMAFSSLSQSLMDLTVNGEFNFKKFIASMLQGLAQLLIQLTIITPIMEGFKKSFSTSSGGGWGGLLSNILGSFPKFADGGDPPVGKVSIVGERGPELFVPKTAGTIIPNHALGGGNQAIYLTVNVEGGDKPEETGAIVGAKVIQMVKGVVKQELATQQRQMRYAT